MAIDALIYVAQEPPQPEPLADARPEPKKVAIVDRLDGKWVQTVALLGLGFGGALLARYYALIGFLPDIDWRESLTFLSVVALSGAWLVALYGLLLFLPGVIWSVVLVADPALRNLMCFETSPQRHEPCPVGVSKALGAPFALFFLIAHLPMAWGARPLRVLEAGILGLAPALVWLGFVLLKELVPQRELWGGWWRYKPLSSFLARHLAFFAFSGLISLSSLLALYRLLSPESFSTPGHGVNIRMIGLLATCSLLSAVANVAVALLFRQSRVRAVVTGVVAAFLLFLAAETIPEGRYTLSARIAAQFGIGDEIDHTLVLNNEGAELAASLGLNPNDADSGASVEHVHVLSRLGRSYLLEIDRRRIVFPRSMVLASTTPTNPLK